MKNIYLQITPFFPTSTRFYGPYVYDQVKAIQNNSDYKVVVIKILSPYDRHHSSDSYTYNGIQVYNFKVWDLPSTILPGIFHFFNYRRFLQMLDRIGVRTDDISFVHAHAAYPAGALAVFMKRDFGIPAIVQHHGFDIFQQESGRILFGPIKKLNAYHLKQYILNIVNSASLNVGVSRKILEKLRIQGYVNTSEYVLYNGVDKAKFFKKKRKTHSFFTIGCVANFWPLKDHMTLLKALSYLKDEGITDIRLKLIGTGPTRKQCEVFISESGLDSYVSFENEVDHTMLNDFYNELDLFVLPSYYEAFGCVYTEAMQCGVPIVAVKGQGIEEVLEPQDKESSLIEKGDARQLANLIKLRYNSPYRVDYDFDINEYIQEFLDFLHSKFEKGGH